MHHNGRAQEAVYQPAAKDIWNRSGTISVAGDQLTGPQIAAVFSIVTGRHMLYKRGPPHMLLRCFSREAYMQSRFIDDVGFCANVGECRKLLPSMHTLEGALRANDFEGKPSLDFQQSVCCDCHT